ncbi:MAG: hypothetical protein HUK40_17740 [Desulfobacter sp.]|nr:hypothetical protein [Desulfobacter sp.]WDP86849.1 MAG: hypothetical protein HUN05_18390 [Desulfobacter sp.]
MLVLATTSRKPVYNASDFYADLVISLGADTDYQHELESDLIARSDIYVESMDSVRYGDIRLWLDQGRIDRGGLIDLFSLLKSNSPVNMEK